MTDKHKPASTLEDLNIQYNIICAKLGDIVFKRKQTDEEMIRLETLDLELSKEHDNLCAQINHINDIAGELKAASKASQASQANEHTPSPLKPLEELTEPSDATKAYKALGHVNLAAENASDASQADISSAETSDTSDTSKLEHALRINP